MAKDNENDVVHLKAGENLPALPVSSPTTEMLKQLLDQMLENERRRLRNEYVRITMLFIVLLAVAIGSGLWFAHSLLDQLHTERQTANRSMQALLQRLAPDGDRLPDNNRQSRSGDPSARPAPAPAADTNTVREQAEIKRMLTDLDAKKQVLADMLKAQDAQTKDLLQRRDNELKILHERMEEVQRKVMNAVPPEARPAKAEQTPAAQVPAAVEPKAVNTLTVTTTNAVPLRLPIPAP